MNRVCLLVLAALLIVAVPLAVWLYAPAPPPVYAEDIISISLSGNITFTNLNPGDTDIAADTSPAITITVEPDTTVIVDIGIMGGVTDGIALNNWKYSTTDDPTLHSLVDTGYVLTYSNKPSDDYYFYHWITVPNGTPAGSHTANISYKAVKTGDPF
jgi:hypothetical protein